MKILEIIYQLNGSLQMFPSSHNSSFLLLSFHSKFELNLINYFHVGHPTIVSLTLQALFVNKTKMIQKYFWIACQFFQKLFHSKIRLRKILCHFLDFCLLPPDHTRIQYIISILPYGLEGHLTLHRQYDSLRKLLEDTDLRYENIIRSFNFSLKHTHSL